MVRHQAIFWTNDDLLSIVHLETSPREILIKMQQFSSKKIDFKIWPANGADFVSSCYAYTAFLRYYTLSYFIAWFTHIL